MLQRARSCRRPVARHRAAQPIEYAEDVGRDFIRYFDPGFKPQDFSGVGYDVLDVARRAGGIEDIVAQQLNSYYADDTYEIDAA